MDRQKATIKNVLILGIQHDQPLDVPDKSFTGPF
jgi:hypothetical protein